MCFHQSSTSNTNNRPISSQDNAQYIPLLCMPGTVHYSLSARLMNHADFNCHLGGWQDCSSLYFSALTFGICSSFQSEESL